MVLWDWVEDAFLESVGVRCCLAWIGWGGVRYNGMGWGGIGWDGMG